MALTGFSVYGSNSSPQVIKFTNSTFCGGVLVGSESIGITTVAFNIHIQFLNRLMEISK